MLIVSLPSNDINLKVSLGI